MYSIDVEVKNMFNGEVCRTEHIPMYSLWAATPYAEHIAECKDVGTVRIIDTTTGEVMAEWNVRE